MSAPTFVIAVPIHRTPLSRIQTTVASILGQSALKDGRARLILRVVASSLDDASWSWVRGLPEEDVEVILDRGEGLYTALRMALEIAEGDFFGYLGGGDAYEPTAFELVMEGARLTTAASGAAWVTGRIQSRREDGALVRSLLPYRYRRRYWRSGLHGTTLPSVQQESTLWSRQLNDTIDWERLRGLRLAGDFVLWQTFAECCDPVILDAAIGSFSWHQDNMSADWAAYLDEIYSLSERAPLWRRGLARLEKVLWGAPDALKSRLSSQVHRYSWPDGPWS